MTTDPARRPARVSFAQNREDILLDRLFGDHVGRFMDIGSCHPIQCNNTYFFYQRGWKGINVEPTRQGHALFQAHRPGDLNLDVAVSDHDGELTLYEVVNDPGDSTLHREIAENYRARGIEIAAHTVPVRTVRSLIETYSIEPPDLLSIDVEGHEAAVIRGIPLDVWRPRVLVVEATLPWTTTPSHQDWEPILLEQGYLFAAFNGLNRFYLREDLRDRLDCFATPVSVLDNFVAHDVLAQSEHVAELERQLAHQRDRLVVEHQQYQELRHAWEAERLAMDRERADWARQRAETEQQLGRERADWARQRAEIQQQLGRERADWARQRAEIEQHVAWLQGQLELTQRQLRPYRLLDGLGVVNMGYGWARKLKHRLVS
jgi:FkbM family methyltransferase